MIGFIQPWADPDGPDQRGAREWQRAIGHPRDRHANPANGPEHDIPNRARTSVGIHPDSHHDSLVFLLLGYPGLRSREPGRVE